MKLKRIIIWACAIIVALTPFCAFAEDYRSIAADTYRALAGQDSLQGWIDGDIASGAGGHTDNYIFSLYHESKAENASFDFKDYGEALYRAIKENDFDSPVSKQKSALALIAVGGGASLAEGVADDTIGKLGVMSYVFGLHLINNGAPSELWTEEALVEKILSLQKQDGGWAVTGNYGDVDVTSMCIQALSFADYGEDAEKAVAAAVDFLAGKQLDSAGFASYGLENCESCAQVLIALDCLGIDYTADERFIKNGRTVLDAMLSFRMEDMLYQHADGTGFNDMACAQALSALVALGTDSHFYDLSPASLIEISANSGAVSGVKLYILIGIAVFTLAGAVFSLSRKRGRIKQLIAVILIAGAAVAATLLINVESTADYYGGEGRKLARTDGYVTFSIDCKKLAGKEGDAIPEDGIILSDTRLPFQDGDSVFDILTDAVRIGGIQMEYSGASRKLAYVNGISNLYEYDYGELSGWMYSVNGEFHSLGSGSFTVKDGDEIRWQYTLELGEDLK